MPTAATADSTSPAPSADAQASEAIRLIPIEEVMARCGMGRTAVYGRVKAGTFPAPAKVGSSSRWISTEIERWVRDVIATRPKQEAAAS